MKDITDISISFDPNLFVHTTKQIVGHYYNEYVEINENVWISKKANIAKII